MAKVVIVETDKPFWFFTDEADTDYLAARLLTFCGIPMWSKAAYHSHQALEKYIKAFLVQEAQSFPEVHNLKVLREFAEKHSALFGQQEIKELLKKFDDFEQVSRYGGLAKYDPISTSNESFTLAGGFIWSDANLKDLDMLVFNIRKLINFSEKPTLDAINELLKNNPSASIVKDWRLSKIPIREILISGNDFFK